jgi:protein-S-isoprenylcysteine O-methyltransferase Ste14
MLFWRALAAFLVLPGMVAFGLPLVLARHSLNWPVARPWGLALVVAGSVLLFACVREFYVAGQGTLAPWSPPRFLVTSGPYRISRNPMFVAVLTILVGWAVALDSRTLLYYAIGAAISVHLWVLWFEEPWAMRQFGAEFAAYRARVPRWIPRPGRRAPRHDSERRVR